MSETSYKILIVDDEEDIVEILQYNLSKVGYNVSVARDGCEAIKKAKKILPDLVLLDVMMPNMDGMQTCEELREIPELKDTVIAFLTARAEDFSEIAGFSAGADDYITKPIRPKVLIARIQTLLKRQNREQVQESKIIEYNNLKIDEERHSVVHNGIEVYLPNKEFKLLLLLAKKPNKLYSREEIYNAVWGTDIIVGDRTIDVHIRKLREKLNNEYIHTIKGIGYTFEKR